MLINDFSNRSLTSELGTGWRVVSDQVMGGRSEARIDLTALDDRHCLRLTGDVCLENDGGFVQASLDLAASGDALDASAFHGIRLVARGNDERYSLHLRTTDTMRPWQSYRAQFIASTDWQAIELPFTEFVPHRFDTAMNLKRLRRLGLVAIGRAFQADIAVAKISFC